MTANTAHWLGFVIQQCVSCCPVTQRQPSDFIFLLFFFCYPQFCKKHALSYSSAFLSAQGLDHIAENILSFLDARSLCSAELVCKEWQRVISEGMLWKKLIERMVRTDPLWKGLSERHQWWEHKGWLLHTHPDLTLLLIWLPSTLVPPEVIFPVPVFQY